MPEESIEKFLAMAVEVATLSERIDQQELRMNERFSAADRAVEAAFKSAEKAVTKAEEKLDKTLIGFPQEYARRLELDQFGGDLAELKNELGKMVSRPELKTTVDSMNQLIDRNREDIEGLGKRLA
jgi:hypothetical protein